MLESEAWGKWCSNVRVIQLDDGNLLDNRGVMTSDPYAWHGCLGPTCACWVDDGYNDKAGEREGHCGLAR